jgi:hypothetical protein
MIKIANILIMYTLNFGKYFNCFKFYLQNNLLFQLYVYNNNNYSISNLFISMNLLYYFINELKIYLNYLEIQQY